MTNRNGLLVDTSALIAFVQPLDPHNLMAVSYVEQAIRDGVPLYISSLTIAEFCCKQDFGTIDQNTFIIEGFETPEAALAGQMDSQLKRESGDDRVAMKVDVMLIAHAEKLGVNGLLTCDANSLAKFCRRLHASGHTGVLPIVTSEPFLPGKVQNASLSSLLATNSTH